MRYEKTVDKVTKSIDLRVDNELACVFLNSEAGRRGYQAFITGMGRSHELYDVDHQRVILGAIDSVEQGHVSHRFVSQ